MITLAPDEKSTMVMVYTRNSLVRGELVTKESVRVSILLRTDSTSRFICLRNAQMIFFGGGPTPRSSNHTEIYIPSAEVGGFHIAPPAHDPLDYDEEEKNRTEEIVSVGVGTFIFKGKLRFSAQGGLATSMQMLYSWTSLYDVEITNPSLPQMAVMHVPMLMIHPAQATFAL